MKKIAIYSLMFCGLLAFTSCEKWLQGQVIDFDLPDHDPVLTAYCYLGGGYSEIDVQLGGSVSILSDGEPQPVENANLKLYKDGVLVQEWSPTPRYVVDTLWTWFDPVLNDTIYYIDSTFTYRTPLDESIATTAGAVYRLEASAEGFEPIFSEQVMPSVPVVAVTMEKDVNVSAEVQWGYESVGDVYNVTVDDASETNYYLILFEAVYEYDNGLNSQRIQVFLNSPETILEYSNGGWLVNDQSFNGSQRAFKFEHWFYPGEERPDRMNVKVLSVNKSYFDFQRSLNDYYSAEFNPFAEPVVLYSNIENGLGLFTLHNRTSVEIERE